MKKTTLITILILILAFFVHMLVVIPSGSRLCINGSCGLQFWGAHGHDGLWHLAVSSVSFSQYPLISPTFFGAKLTGYNFLLDYILYVLEKIHIPSIFTYFKLLPILWFIIISYLLFIFSKMYDSRKSFLNWFLFFVFFGGSFSYLFTLFHSGTIWGSAGLQAMQSALILVNMQFAFSLPVFLLTFILLIHKKKRTIHFLLIGFLTALAFGLKFYGGTILLVVTLTFLVLDFLQKKEIRLLLLRISAILIPVMLTIFLIYNPLEAGKTGSIFIFSPFSMVHSIIEEPLQFYLPKIINARYFLQSQNMLSPRLLLIEFCTVGLFLFINFGTRLVGLYLFVKKFKKIQVSKFESSIAIGILSSCFITVFFIQKGEWWNTIQFLYFGFFLSGIFAARAMAELSLKKMGIIIGAVIILLTIPNTIDTVHIFIQKPSTYISDTEMQALTYLSKLQNGVVFTPLFDTNNKDMYSIPYPIYAYVDTSYVSAFGRKQLYFGNITQLKISGIDYKKRELYMNNMTNKKLVKLPITYLYIQKPYKNLYQNIINRTNMESKEIYFKKLFENKEAIIYVKKSL